MKKSIDKYNGIKEREKSRDGRGGQTRTDNPSLPKRVRYQLRYAPTYTTEYSVEYSLIDCTFFAMILIWGEWWELNPRPSEPQPDALPIELHPPQRS